MGSSKRKRQKYLFAIGLLLLTYAVLGFYPFHLKPSPTDDPVNGAMVLPDRGIRFLTPGIAYTEGRTSWLEDAISASRFQVFLEVRTSYPEQYGPARIFTVLPEDSRRHLTISQWGSDLSVRLGTPDTGVNGTPACVVKKVFADLDWRKIYIRVTPGTMEVRVDEKAPVVAPIPTRRLQNWDADSRIALGNELSGDRPWLGDIRKAVVHVGERSFDYLTPGALHFPKRLTLKNLHAAKIIPFVDVHHLWAAVKDWTINLLGFVPFGWLVVLLRWPRPGVLLAIVLGAGVSTMLEAGQLLIFSERFPSAEDIIMNTLGAALGARIAKRRLHQRIGG